MKTLQETTVSELVTELEHLEAFLKDMPHSFLHRVAFQMVQDELDSSCEKAGIKTNPDGTFYIPEFTGNADEMKERAALINYFTHKQ